MDFMRKLVRSSTSATSQFPQSNNLGLLTLRRQFRDACFTSRPLPVSEAEEKLYKVLPLFLQVFKGSPPQNMKEKFGDVLEFSTRTSSLMVTEIRRRASNKSTEEASVDLANFLAPNEVKSNGWTLLNVLLLLAAGDQSIIDCMTEAHLPSTLVKCLYLFFDLPPHDSNPSYIVSVEEKDELQKVFAQTLVRLCGYILPTEELSRKDDLSLLFSAVTSWCYPHNKKWRTAASEVLITVSRHGLSHHVVQYIRSKNCIKKCIDNLWRVTVSVGENSPSSVLLDVDLADQLLCVIRFINNTSEVTQLLLDDFRQNQGYIFIAEFVLRLETAASSSERHNKALLSVVGSIEKLTTCGFKEILPDPSVHQSFQSNFVVPAPIGKGESVRNIPAFELLENLFIRSRTTLLSRAVLDAVFAVYCRDPANYFILSNLNTMSNFSERLPLKDPEVYPQFFAILEYISLTLRFIPRKELISISLLLKTDSNIECCIACLKSLQKLLSSNSNTYRDVFREVGLLEMFIKCLQRYSSLMKAVQVSSNNDSAPQINKLQHTFGQLTMDVLVDMIHSSPTNASIFRETGGARCAYNTLSYSDCRRSALSLVEALILQPPSDRNDDDMATILGLLSTLAPSDIQLKIDMLKSLYKVIRKSNLASIMFQNVGGILTLISIIVNMEGYLSLEPPDLWKERSADGFFLLEISFRILTIVLAQSSNEKYFVTEVGYDSLLKALMRLGCFSQPAVVTDVKASEATCTHSSKPAYLQISLRYQEFPFDDEATKEVLLLQKILCFFKLLYMSACDLFKDELQTKIEELQHNTSKCSYTSDDSPRSYHESSRGNIFHPNIFRMFLKLIPLLYIEGLDQKDLVPIQLYLMEEVNNILNNERNEQIVCEVGLLLTLLSSFEFILINDNHPINLMCQKTLERLATQSVSPQELRMLLRIGKPLRCENLFLDNGVVSLNRVKSLVSVATPRNVGMISDISSTYKSPPSFIEFNMTMEGSSHLFIPFIFPQSTSTSTPATSVSTERIFPPSHGIAVSMWFYVDSFCRHQVHPVRLFSIERQILATKQRFMCLSIMISPRRRRLVISTNELNVSNIAPGGVEFDDTKDTVGFNMDHLGIEGQWHHLQVIIHRATVLKHGTVTACFNDNILGISKIRYINLSPGGSSQQSLNSPVVVHGLVGTPAQFATPSSLVWRMGSLRVFDETSAFVPSVSSIFTKLGPNYVGNFQNILLPDGNFGAAFLEDHLCFSLLPSSRTNLSPQLIQRSKTKFDLKIIASKLNIEKEDDLLSLDFYPNTCFHYSGPGRTYGAFAVGKRYKEAPRCFYPKGVGSVLQDVGGISVSLYLVAMATDVEGLYAAVKFLVCVLKSDRRAVMEMERSNGYQALGMLLKEKKHLLNSHILHLTFSIAGTVDTGQGTTSVVTNQSAFEYLLCDLEIWHSAPQELHKSLFDHFYELLTESSDRKNSHSTITSFNFVQRCVYFMYSDSSLSYVTICTIIKVLQAIFSIETRKQDLLCFGQFVVCLISSSSICETDAVIGDTATEFSENDAKGKTDEKTFNKRNIHFRNIALNLIIKSITSSPTSFCEILEETLGFDWVLLFMQSHLHNTTVTIALRLLFTILQCSYIFQFTNSTSNLSAAALQAPALNVYSSPPTLIERFRSGENFGGWLQGTNVLVEKKEDSLLGFNVRSINDFTSDRYHQSVLMDAVPVPGFLALQYLLSFHASSQPVLKLLIQFLIGDYDYITGLTEFTSDDVHRYLKSSSRTKLNENQKTLSLEIVQAINSMLRQLLHQDLKNSDKFSSLQTNPLTLIDAYEFTYVNNTSTLSYLFATPEFLASLLLSLFPPDNSICSSVKDLLSLEGLFPVITSSASKLSTHPAVKPLYLFLCKILWDSTTAVKNKSSQIIDILLEIPSERIPNSCLREYLTAVIVHVTDYCVPNLADLIKSSHCSTTIAYMVSRIVDKVWQGSFSEDCRKIFDFITHIISTYHHKMSSQVLASLYKSLYRLVLYQLSRNHSTVSNKMVLLDALHCLTTHRSVVFDAKFRDATYLSCLCHCIFMVSGDSAGNEYGLEAEQRQTTWHVSESTKQSPTTSEVPENPISVAPVAPQPKAQQLLNKAAARVWKELLSSKRETLMDIFKVILRSSDIEQEDLDFARGQLREASAKAWSNYLLSEKKGLLGGAKESLQQQKLMKRMSNVVLGSGKKTKKDFAWKLGKNITIQDSHLWTLNHISVVQSLVRLQSNEREQEESYLKRFTSKEWDRTTSELTRERGVWGPENEENLTKWTLDSTEGPSRMRKRMMKDETFYLRYPHRAKTDSSNPKHKKPTSRDSLEYYRRVNCLSPYFNSENENSSSSPNASSPQTVNEENCKSTPDAESSCDEVDNEECVILNLCLKCQPSQTDTSMKVNTLSGNEALSCDLCDHSLKQSEANPPDDVDDANADEKSPSNNNCLEDVLTDDGQRNDSPMNIDVKNTRTDSSKTTDQTDDGGLSASPNDQTGTPKKVNGMVTSESFPNLSDQNQQDKDKGDNQTILKLLEKGEKIRHMFRVARVQGLDVHEGLLLFGQDHYYIIDGFTMLRSKEIRDIASLPGEHEPIIPSSSRHNQESLKNENSLMDRMCSKFSYSDIREVHKRRYLLQNIALEVFNKDGRNCLLVFPQGTRTKVFNKFTSYAPTLSDRGKDSVVGQRSGLSVEQQGPPVWFGLIGEKTVTSRWERGEISNFQYLMYVNTLAGRSYNDLMQYPIFPWIIADYDSEVLDLTNPETFRDLSKPMGAQTDSRLEQYKKRYRDWEELGGIETPPYHYGTHYSSAMIVASYLVRMEPFTQHFLRLQGGHFDLADRMFHSIKDSWTSASQKNMADVKELIPEFFYLPEFLLNTNRFDLGQKQNGVHLDDVILPAWARGSPHEFIRAHREALESDYVSSHLHEWIDLIFGYKQKGEAALEAYNVFHHLFYEGEVDIYSIKDPLRRNATIGFINNFGQIPKQLFKRPHPQKKCKADGTSTPSSDKIFYKRFETLSTSNPVKEIHEPVGQMVVHDRGVSVTEVGKILIPPLNTRYVSWGHKDLSVKVGNYENERAIQTFENLDCDEITCAAMASENLLVTGNKSTVVHVWHLPAMKDKNKNLDLVKSLYGHTMAVTSVATCASYGIIVSGAEDGSCIIWDLNHLAFVRQLQHQHGCPISHICINEKTGAIVTSSGTNLYLWSINGLLIACASALSSNAKSQQITALSMSKLNEWDPEAVIVTGHSDGHLRFWICEYVQVPESTPLIDLQVYASDSAKPQAMQKIIKFSKSPDNLSLASIGEVAELPWNDVSKVEISNQECSQQMEQQSDVIRLKWKEQLVLKGKIELPSHTSKTRGSYVPSVTCIAMSKNHELLYVGDEEGRVFLWTCS